MFGRYVPVVAEVVQDVEFSVHGDASDLIDWLRELSPERPCVTHGEEGSASALAARITRELGVPHGGAEIPRGRQPEPSAHGYTVLSPGEDAVASTGDGAATVGIGAGPIVQPAGYGASASGWQRGDGTTAGAGGAGAEAPGKPSGWVNVAAPAAAHGAPAAAPAHAGHAVAHAVAHATAPAASQLPAGKQRYRCITGPDDATFCERVSAALAEGYVLSGSPAVTFDGAKVILAQAVVWPGLSLDRKRRTRA